MKNDDNDSDTRWFPPATQRYLVHQDCHFWNKASSKRVDVRSDGTVRLLINGQYKALIAKDIVDFLFYDGEEC